MSSVDVDPEFKLVGKDRIPEDIQYFITAMPENGFSGVLALRQLVDDLNLEQIGYAHSDITNTLFRFEDGEPKSLIPLYANDGLLVLPFEMPITNPMSLPVGRLIHRITTEYNVENLVMLSSAPSSTRRDKSFEDLRTLTAFIGDNYAEKVKELDLEIVDNAMLSGPFAWVLNNRLAEGKGGIILLAETFPSPMVDPASAARLLDSLGEFLGKEDQMSVQQLIEQSHEVKSKLQKLQQVAQKSQAEQTTQLSDFYT